VAVFPIPWDGVFDSEPADNENINLGAGRIRDLKNAIQLRMLVDHSWMGDPNDGKHIKSDYVVQVSDPALDPTDGAVYTKSVAGTTELFYKDSSGRVAQLTSAGQAASSFPTGTTITFLQAAPPAGWVQNMAFNDMMVRVVSAGGGGSTGGNWSITGLNGATDAHTLLVGEIPQHTHNVTVAISPAILVTAGSTSVPSSGGTVLTTDGGTGGAGGHSHTITNGLTGDSSWRPAYVNACVGIKT
jgi:hypothetical protein